MAFYLGFYGLRPQQKSAKTVMRFVTKRRERFLVRNALALLLLSGEGSAFAWAGIPEGISACNGALYAIAIIELIPLAIKGEAAAQTSVACAF
jgi:hypothetical protein